MIIVRKQHIGSGYHNLGLGLCEEVRRTDKRVYVHLIKEGGYTYAGIVSGKSPNQYVETQNVIAWFADEAMFESMLACIKQSDIEQQRLRRELREEYDTRDRNLDAIAQRIESAAIQEE